jgi:deoxyribonuclease-1
MKLLIVIILITGNVFADNFNHKVSSFNKAKKILKKIYPEYKTFYCGCDYSYKTKKVDTSSCGYIPSGNYKGFIDWEHVSAASSFGRHLPFWFKGDPKCIIKKGKNKGKRYKGRRCAKKDPKYKAMEADLHNLVPALPELNRRRSNFRLTEISGEKRKYGECDFEIENRKAEPRDSVKGDVARIMFYMQDRYGIKVISNRKLYDAWNKLDPIDSEEKRINCLKAKYQGNVNKFIGECK